MSSTSILLLCALVGLECLIFTRAHCSWLMRPFVIKWILNRLNDGILMLVMDVNALVSARCVLLRSSSRGAE